MERGEGVLVVMHHSTFVHMRRSELNEYYRGQMLVVLGMIPLLPVLLWL